MTLEGLGVTFDFSDIAGSSAVDSTVNPTDIYAALPSPPWPYLRQPQGTVLDQWFARREERDLVIKMNTGAGKTVVGLLALKSSLNEGKGPGAYFASDKYLAQQVIAEATRLGLETTTDPRAPAFASGEAILVTNIWTLFNGRSKFGVGQKKIHVGTVLIDDAHACLKTAEDVFTLSVPRELTAYADLLNLFRDAFAEQSPVALLDLESQKRDAIYEVPFWEWSGRTDEVTAILHPLGTGESDLAWSWPLVSDVLPICTCIFTASAVEISPPCLPSSVVPSFATAPRRLYLTATLSDDSILVSDFDASPESVSRPISPGSADDIGDRLILAPNELIPNLSEDDLRELLVDLSAQESVVILVPSFARAEYWREIASDILSSRDGNLETGIARLARPNATGITVMVAKYDGVDLPDGACRVLVLDGVPASQSARGRMHAGAMADATIALPDQMQSIEQGMGRAVRSKQDYCVVLLLGAKLAQLISSPQGRAYVSPATRKQLDLSRQVARKLSGAGLSGLRSAIDQCLEQDPDWKRASRGVLSGTKYPESVTVSQATVERRAAFDAAAVGQYQAAAGHLQSAVNLEDSKRPRAWLKRELAIYTHFTDPVEAQQILVSAIAENRYLRPKPRVGITYSRLDVTAESQSARLSSLLTDRFESSNALLLGYEAALEDLRLPSRSSGAFEASLRELGLLLGFASERPEQELNEGPDNLWAISSGKYLVIECKSQAEAPAISKSDMNQLAGSINWFHKRYPADSGQGIVVHPSRSFRSDTTPPADARVTTSKDLERLRGAVRDFSRALAASGPPWSADEISARLNELGLGSTTIVGKFTSTPKQR